MRSSGPGILFLLACLVGTLPLGAQQQRVQLRSWAAPRIGAAARHQAGPADSVRVQVGYQQWRDAAIGGGIGALVGALAVAVVGSGGNCSDCSQHSQGHNALMGALLGGGVGGVIGFVSGLASPRYAWVEPPSVPGTGAAP